MSLASLLTSHRYKGLPVPPVQQPLFSYLVFTNVPSNENFVEQVEKSFVKTFKKINKSRRRTFPCQCARSVDNGLLFIYLLISLFQSSTCFEHMCSSSGGQKLYYTVSGITSLLILFSVAMCAKFPSHFSPSTPPPYPSFLLQCTPFCKPVFGAPKLSYVKLAAMQPAQVTVSHQHLPYIYQTSSVFGATTDSRAQ